MNIEIDHLGIAVRSLEESLRFYKGVLGMEDVERELVETERVHIAMLPTGTGIDAPRIELLEASDEHSVIAKFIEKRGPGLHHIALRVDDLYLAVKRVQDAGGRLLSTPSRGAGGHIYVFVHPASTGGVLVELIQK